FVFPATSPTLVSTLSLHDALPISGSAGRGRLSVYLKFPSSAVRWVVFCHTPERSLCLLRGVLSEPGFTSGTQPSLWGLYRLAARSEEHTSELQSRSDLVCRLLLEK